MQLFHQLRPFFNNKPVSIVLAKMDAWTPEELSPVEFEMIQSLSPNFPLRDSF